MSHPWKSRNVTLAVDNHEKLKALLPANVPSSFLDGLIRQQPAISVDDVCKALIHESRQREQAARIATLVNKSREKIWKH